MGCFATRADGSVIFRRSSGFAIRESCTRYDLDLSILYDCEALTDWIHTDTLPADASSGVPVTHIHDNGAGLFEDCAPCHDEFPPTWETCRDPFRAAGAPAQTICFECNLLEGSCCCQTPRWLDGQRANSRA